MLPAKKTENHVDAVNVNQSSSEKIKHKTCIGKQYGYTCQTCTLRSYCDGIPEIKRTKQ